MAWNGWYHVNGHTHGTWLLGDHRGWRERHHRRHIEGDYKNPPAPGTFEGLERRSHDLMKRPPIFLNDEMKPVAGRAMIDKLSDKGVEVIAFSLDRVHYHFLGKFPDEDVRSRVGLAKKSSAFALQSFGLAGVWAVRCQVVPIEDRDHQLKTFQYILDHKDKSGAWTWSFREGRPWIASEDPNEKP